MWEGSKTALLAGDKLQTHAALTNECSRYKLQYKAFVQACPRMNWCAALLILFVMYICWKVSLGINQGIAYSSLCAFIMRLCYLPGSYTYNTWSVCESEYKLNVIIIYQMANITLTVGDWLIYERLPYSYPDN